MPDGWLRCALGDLAAAGPDSTATGPFGSAVSAKNFRTSGVPMIRGKNLSTSIDERLIDDGLVFLDADLVARYPRSIVREGDLVFTCWGTVGQVGLIDDRSRYDSYIVSNKQMKFTPAIDKADPLFLYYLLAQPSTVAAVVGDAIGSSVPGFNLGQLRRLPVEVPPVDEQRRIAGVLGALDDLIDTNRRLSHDSSMLAVTLASAAPDQVALREVARLVDAQQFQPDGPIDHFSIPAVDERKLPERVDGAAIKSGKLRLMGPTVLVSRLNPQTPRVWMAYPGDAPAGASTEFVTLQSSDDSSVEEVWAACASEKFASQMRSRVTGTTGSHQRVDKAAIPSLLVADIRLLDRATRTAISLLVRDAHESLIAASEAARTRDELLPLLLSGRVRVSADSSHSPGSCNGSLSASMS